MKPGTKGGATWPTAAAMLIAVAAVLIGGYRVYGWWHDAHALHLLAEYCSRDSEGCRLWFIDGTFHAFNAQDYRKLERDQQQMPPAITRPSTRL